MPVRAVAIRVEPEWGAALEPILQAAGWQTSTDAAIEVRSSPTDGPTSRWVVWLVPEGGAPPSGAAYWVSTADLGALPDRLARAEAAYASDRRRKWRHDLRGALAVVQGHADLMIQGFRGPLTDAQRTSLDAVVRAVDRATALLDEEPRT